MHHLAAIPPTIVRVVIPLLAGLGGAAGAFAAILKLFPERTAIVVTYQSEVIVSLRDENKRLSETVARLELRVNALEDEPRPHLA